VRYADNFLINATQALKTGNKDVQKDMIFSEVASLIAEHPDKVIVALKESGVEVPTGIETRSLIKLTVKNLFENKSFQKELAVLISQYVLIKTPQEYSNVTALDWIGDIANMIEGVATPIIEAEYTDERIKEAQAQAEAQITAQVLLEREKRKKMLPLMIIGGTLLIGGIVLFFALRNKRKTT
jgi:hypothetical protein